MSGQLHEDAVQAFELMGIRRDAFDFNKDNLGQLVEFTVGGALRRPRAVRADKSVLYDLEWSTPFHISMLQLGLYRSFKYQGWQEPLIVVAGETFEDFCLYYCLSRLRDRVAWLMPSITQRALGSNPDPFSRAELSFLSELQFEGTSTQNLGRRGVRNLLTWGRGATCGDRTPERHSPWKVPISDHKGRGYRDAYTFSAGRL